MSILPIAQTVTVKAPPALAFDYFTKSMGKWWPKGIGERPLVEIIMEPRAGGQWFERDAEGVDTHWGTVSVWEPPFRILLSWQLNSRWKFDPAFSTELEILFKPTPQGGTVVSLEHRQLERYGADAARHSDALRGGWPTILENFARYAEAAMPASDELIVHAVPGSPFARAVLAALEEKGAAYRIRPLNGEIVRSDDYAKLHPFNRIPVVQHGDFVLYETQAILRYLDRVLVSGSLSPSDAKQLARMDQLMNINDWYLFRGVADVIGFQRIIKPMFYGQPADEEAVKAGLPAAKRVYDVLASLLGDNRFFVGDQVTLADLMIGAQLEMLAQIPECAAMAAAHPNLPRWLARMVERESFKATTRERIVARIEAGGA